MAFPKLGKWVSVTTAGGEKVGGALMVINLERQQAYLERRNGTGVWVPLDLIRAKYGK